MSLEPYCIVCSHCSTPTTLELDPEKVARWRQGELIQRVFPEMSANLRELLISRTCGKCWSDMFGEEVPKEEGHYILGANS